MSLKLEVKQPKVSSLDLLCLDIPGDKTYVSIITHDGHSIRATMERNDTILITTKRDPDPYQMLADELGISRDEVKNRLLMPMRPPTAKNFMAKITTQYEIGRDSLRHIIEAAINKAYLDAKPEVQVR